MSTCIGINTEKYIVLYVSSAGLQHDVTIYGVLFKVYGI